ncbi:MAG: hypothetical protein ACP5KL_03545 [Thermoplasmata archaeon]
MDVLSMIRFLTGILFLSVASYQDIRDREVNSFIFFLMGIVASALIIYEFFPGALIPVLIFFLSFLDLKSFDHVLNILFIVSSIFYIIYNGSYIIFILSILLIIYKYLHYTGILPGGADMRAIMAISLLVPYYPETFTGLNVKFQFISIIFPYSIEVLFYAAILNALIYLPYVYYLNYRNKNIKVPEMFTKVYRDGKWVPYETPFIFSITIAFLISFFFSLFSVL